MENTKISVKQIGDTGELSMDYDISSQNTFENKTDQSKSFYSIELKVLIDGYGEVDSLRNSLGNDQEAIIDKDNKEIRSSNIKMICLCENKTPARNIWGYLI